MNKDVIGDSHEDLAAALTELCAQLNNAGATWLLGGSCGLWLQGVPLERAPRDIDVYCDRVDLSGLHDRLAGRALDEPKWDESGCYASLLSHYRIKAITIELVGSFEIRKGNSIYRTEVNAVLKKHAHHKLLEGVSVPLMPLAHELLFNVLRERPDRYTAVAQVIRSSPDHHMPLLQALLAGNVWEPQVVSGVAELLKAPQLYEQWLIKRNAEA